MNITTRKIVLLGLAAAASFLSACGYHVYLKQSLDETSISATRPIEKVNPAFSVNSKVIDPNNVPWPMVISVNPAFTADLNEYFHTKFPTTAAPQNKPSNDLSIDVTLSTYTVNIRLDSTRIADSTMAMTVVVKEKGKALPEKIIRANNESTGVNADVMAQTLSGNINKLIVLLEKYLTSLGY